jgi:hypothetical protein
MERASLMHLCVASPAAARALYQTQDAAQHACLKDTVVWLNRRSDICHFQGECWYDNTEEAPLVCKKDADSNSDRATESGQQFYP